MLVRNGWFAWAFVAALVGLTVNALAAGIFAAAGALWSVVLSLSHKRTIWAAVLQLPDGRKLLHIPDPYHPRLIPLPEDLTLVAKYRPGGGDWLRYKTSKFGSRPVLIASSKGGGPSAPIEYGPREWRRLRFGLWSSL